MPRVRCRCPAGRVPGTRPRAGRPAGRLPRRARRDAGPAAGDRRGRRLLPRLRTRTRAGRSRRASGRDAIVDEAHAAVADLLGAASPDEIKFGQNMTSLTLHLGRSIGATLRAGRRDRRHDARPRGQRQHLAGDGRGPGRRRSRPSTSTRPTSRSTSRTSSRSSSSRTKLVAVGYASNAVGTINPVPRSSRAPTRSAR